ncbi:MAG: hypothetical protein MJ116_02820 [Lachnospiraceae bacterium]|nr:hypothetical protein [Lachnospiraceae bacterium]
MKRKRIEGYVNGAWLPIKKVKELYPKLHDGRFPITLREVEEYSVIRLIALGALAVVGIAGLMFIRAYLL